MRSNEVRRNVSGFARMIIGENEDDRTSLSQNDNYPPKKRSTIHYSKSSIIRIEHGLFSFDIFFPFPFSLNEDERIIEEKSLSV